MAVSGPAPVQSSNRKSRSRARRQKVMAKVVVPVEGSIERYPGSYAPGVSTASLELDLSGDVFGGPKRFIRYDKLGRTAI